MRRLALICSAVAAFAAAQLASTAPAAAFGCDLWTRGDLDECYNYRPANRGYYPYYNSGQWRPAREMRERRQMSRWHYSYPQYNPVWGHPVDDYNHRDWHARNHGRHRIGHW